MARDSVRDVRLEMRIRNNILWHVIFDNYGSVAEFCKTLGLIQTEVGRLLNLKLYPLRKNGQFRKVCEDIAAAVRMLPEDLFPLRLYEAEKTEAVLEFDSKQIAAAKASGLFPLFSEDPTEKRCPICKG